MHKSTNAQIHKCTNPQIHKSTNPQKIHMPAVFHPPFKNFRLVSLEKVKKKKNWEEGTTRKIKPKKLKNATDDLRKKKNKKK